MSSSTGTVIGNLGKKPELSYNPSGKPMVSFSVAVKERTLNRETNQWVDGLTDWIDCAIFGEGAEGFAQLEKGARVILVGKWKPREYTDKNGVQVKTRNFIVSEGGPSSRWQNVSSAPSSPRNGGGGGYQQQQGGGQPAGGYQQPQQPQGNYQQGGQPAGGFPSDGGFDDEQPF